MPTQLQFMTTKETFDQSSAWKSAHSQAAEMVERPPSEQPRGRYHVDPRGVCSPWVKEDWNRRACNRKRPCHASKASPRECIHPSLYRHFQRRKHFVVLPPPP